METPVVILGGGPAGAASALFLLREGITPVIIEKDLFPRYHIGESMTGECGALLRDLGIGEEMSRRRHPVKHGVRVFGRHSWFVPVMARDEQRLLREQSTWQVRRSDFDRMMLDEALRRGASLIRGRATAPVLSADGAVRGVRVQAADGHVLELRSEVLLDCSGQATFLASAGVTGPKYLGSYDRQIAIFSQVAGGIRDEGGGRETQPGNTLIFYKSKYHWAWWIPLDAAVVSVGVVIPSSYFVEKRESKADFLVREIRELHPELSRRLPEIRLVEATRAIRNYSYQVRRFGGEGFLCIGDAHRFIDPIFSFGLYSAIKEAQLAAPAVRAFLAGGARDDVTPFAAHQRRCEQGLDVLEDTIDAFWEHPLAFAHLVHRRYRTDLIDVFAGRIYDQQPSTGVTELRRLLKRDRSDGSRGDYSVPIGSRFHPERAPLWEGDPAGAAEPGQPAS